MPDSTETIYANRLDGLVHVAGTRAQANGWHNDMPDKDVDPTALLQFVGAKLMLATGEISEAYEEVRDGHGYDEVYYGPDGKPEGFPVEIADAIIRLADLWFCVARDQRGNLLSLEGVVTAKLDYNDSRGHMHGGKKI